MNDNLDATHDTRTVVFDRNAGDEPAAMLTDMTHPPRYESLAKHAVTDGPVPIALSLDIARNPLVGAAFGLLAETARLRTSPPGAPSVRALNERLAEGIRRFESHALRQGVEADQVTAARYVLCTVLDEAAVTADWDKENEWAQISLLSKFHNETFGGEKFFQLLDEATRSPMRHLAMLELMYLCLSLGFQGRYRVQPRGALEVESVRTGLYRQIRQLRGETPRELSPRWAGLPNPRRALIRIVPGWLVMLLTFICLAVIYTGFAWTLGQQRDRILHPFEAVTAPLQLPRPETPT